MEKPAKAKTTRKWSASPLGKAISEELQSGTYFDYHKLRKKVVAKPAINQSNELK